MIIQQPEWQHPVVYPVPETVLSVSSPQIDLCGVWSLARNPEGSYWLRSEQQKITWADTVVPGDLSAARKRRGTWAKEQLVYRKEIDIPQDFAGMHILLRFEGSYGMTRVWADGQFVASHADGFITWYGDLTGFVTAGQPCLLTIAIENNNDDVSGFNQGGLVRGLSLVAMPDPHLARLHVETRFDEAYADATLSVLLEIAGCACTAGIHCAADRPENADQAATEILLELFDPAGAKVLLHRQHLTGVRGQRQEKAEHRAEANVQDRIELPVTRPLKWDAEHPRLYRLQATLLSGGIPVETASRRVGFREIRRIGNRLFVNGDEVKLRGVCRHDISPLNGRTLTDEELRADVRLFKEANINYIRTSHYPPSEAFLDLCDQAGIYVEDEVGLAFIGRSLKYTEKSPAHTERYLTFMSELIERDRSHPCVLIWSLANESFYGPNFAAINAWAHREDPSRPTKFSYPMTMQEEDEPVDIWSVHYPNFDSDLAKKHDNVSVGFLPGRDVPVLHDECTHIPCYNRGEHRRDPAVRVFWGESIRRFWDNIWQTPGALGGAI
ncbi:MAG: glycoside hydrolase family 2 TIM barrel-domain containing protein, partial [Bacillota bacterium]|nr:glycoside hydrolase family 2 TIM barrel-domain containing protein [Bacillota bacterium]